MKAYKRLSILCIAVLLCALLPVLAGATSPGDPPEAVDPNAVYVSVNGDDDGDGSQGNPYATLAKAVEKAEDGATIYVMSNLEMKESARFWNKNLTITSFGEEAVTVTRGEFAKGSSHDLARSWYNSAMIEVGGSDYNLESSLRLENIVFDDKGLTEGTYYVQAESDGDGKSYVGKTEVSNADIVQDAIIATYNNTATITLGNGTVLKNFGGMSAVRISGGVFTMESGSKIIDDTVTDRNKQGSEGDIGPAGAVWVQGGDIAIEHGSEISGVRGRALYVDSGTVSISGTISDITGDQHMWWNQDGVAVHVRNGAHVTLEEDGVITEIKNEGETGDTGSAAYTTNGKFTLDGVIEYCYMRNALFLNASQEENAGIINGSVRHNTSTGSNGYAVVAQSSDLIINSTGVIEENQAGISTVYAPSGANIDLYGTIQNNVGTQCGGIHMYSNWNAGRNITVDMYDGAKIINNSSSGGALNDRGGAVCSGGAGGTSGSTECIFTMHGGEISGNESSNGAVFVRKNGQAYILGGNISKNKGNGIKVQSDSAQPNSFLIMEGGSVIDNEDYGVYFSAGSQAKIDLNGGTIQGNNNGDTQIYVIGGSAKDENERISINNGILLGNTNVRINNDFSPITIDKDYSAIQLGTASSSAKDTIESELSANSKYENWDAIGSSPLYVKPSENTFHFTMARPTGFFGIGGIEPGRGLYVAYVPLQADGTPDADAEVKLEEIVNQETLDITLDNLTAGTSYALMLVVSDEYVLRPDDITIYTGGDEEGFPSWTMENTKPEEGDVRVGDDTTSYTLDNLEELFTVSYYDSEGTALTNDHTPGVYAARFNLSDAAPASLTIESDGSVTGLTIGGNTVRVADGTLTIRYVSDEDEASDNELTEPVVSQVPETLEDMAVAVIQDGATYHTNGSNSGLGESNGKIHLMFDDLLPTGTGGASTDRIQMLIEKAESDNVLSFDGMDYQFKYLDLVDYSNGNAWVSTDKDITIYWPYPAGTDQDTKFTLLHFTGLHREYSLGNEEDLTSQINASVIEKVSVANTDQGIQFTLESDAKNGSFSPFALVWEESAVTPPPVTPSEPADPDDTGVSDLLDTENHNQYLFGYPEGTFGPDQNMTRAEVAQMFYNLLVDKNVAITATFEDVPADAWYAKSVNTLASMGIISGVGENRFEPERSITRAEFTSMAMKFTKGALDGTNVFSDVHSGDWFYEAVVGSIQYGWIEGYEDGTFRPENWITRVEVTSIVNKMLGRFADREFVAGHADELNAFSDVTSTHWGYYHIVEATNSHTYTKPSTNVETWTELK